MVEKGEKKKLTLKIVDAYVKAFEASVDKRFKDNEALSRNIVQDVDQLNQSRLLFGEKIDKVSVRVQVNNVKIDEFEEQRLFFNTQQVVQEKGRVDTAFDASNDIYDTMYRLKTTKLQPKGSTLIQLEGLEPDVKECTRAFKFASGEIVVFTTGWIKDKRLLTAVYSAMAKRGFGWIPDGKRSRWSSIEPVKEQRPRTSRRNDNYDRRRRF